MYFIMNNNSILFQQIKNQSYDVLRYLLGEAILPFSFASFVNYINSCRREFAPLRGEMSLDSVKKCVNIVNR